MAVVQLIELSYADIPCILQKGVGDPAWFMQTVTLHITINVTPPTLYNTPSSIPAAGDSSSAEEAPILGRPQSPSPEHPLYLSRHQPVEAGNDKPQSNEEASPASTKDRRLPLDRDDEAMKLVDRSNVWQGAVGRIKWVMDTLSPISEVRNTLLMPLAELTCTLSFSHSQRWPTVYF